MKKTILIILALTGLMLGCKPKEKPVEYAVGVYPYDLKVSVDNETINLAWKKHGTALISGYNIYLSETPLVANYPDENLPEDIKPFNLTVFPGDTDPDDPIEHYTAEGLTNGKRYYVSVRVVNPDRSLSKPTKELLAVPAPTGEIALAVRYGGDHDGYSFINDHYVQADGTDNDIYYYSKDGKHYLASPKRLDGFLRESRLIKLSFKGDFDEVSRKVTESDLNPSEDRVEVKAGEWVLLRTADSAHVLIKVLDTGGAGGAQELKLFFAMSALRDEIYF